jgi:GDP-L-fucose synthase
MNFWENKTVIVTGGDGFLGRHVVNALGARGVPGRNIYVPGEDLRDAGNVGQMFFSRRPDVVIHLAATVGGIQKNMKQPADMFYDNLKMGMEIINTAVKYPAKIVVMGSACEYPKFTHIPMREEDVSKGDPEDTNLAYGIAKRALLTMGHAYRKQHGLNVIHLLSTNLYGPGDNFGDGSHFIPATIRRMIDAQAAGREAVTLWGTGDATRDFLYVDDAAEGILLAAEKYDSPEPVNLGSGWERTIREIAYKINVLTGFGGAMLWDASMPDGQPRRVLDVSRAKKEFGFEAETLIEAGLERTIRWYRIKHARLL